MSRSLARKRQIQTQNEAGSTRVETTSITLLDGTHVRWLRKGLLRRTRLLFSLLRRYPAAILLVFVIIWIGLRLLSNKSRATSRSGSNLEFQREITTQFHVSLVDDDLIEAFEESQLQRLSNLRETPQGIFIDAQLAGPKEALVKVLTRESSQNASNADYIPRLHRLAKLLHVHQGFTLSYKIRLPILLQEPLADRHVAKALYRACGFRSPTKVAEGATVAAHVVPLRSPSLRFLSALRMPTVEPYEWQSNLPSSLECRRGNYGTSGKIAEQSQCRRMTEMLLVMYLAGCAPPGNDDFVQWEGDDSADYGMFEMAFPRGCFGQDEQNSVLLDIVLAFIGRSCSIPSGLLGLIKRLAGVGWGVGSRAKTLEKRLVLLNDDRSGMCRNLGWLFYAGSIES